MDSFQIAQDAVACSHGTDHPPATQWMSPRYKITAGDNDPWCPSYMPLINFLLTSSLIFPTINTSPHPFKKKLRMIEQKENREKEAAIHITSSVTNYQYYPEQVISLL